MSTLHRLAAAAGLEIDWRNVNGAEQTVSDESLRAVLTAIGFPAESDADIDASLATLRQEREQNTLPLITAMAGERITLAGAPGPYKLTLESGEVLQGRAKAAGAAVVLPAIAVPGYHQLELGGRVTTLAIAPPHGFTLAEAAAGAKLWGLTIQLYGLRRAGDGGIGDFGALADFARHAAAAGAAAIAISPVHAQFSADVTRYSPYAPSSRAALNALYIAADTPPSEDGALINWPLAAAAKLKYLRAQFDAGHDHTALTAYRAAAGLGLERHAIFEALSAALIQGNPAAADWRNWPLPYRTPENPAVARFAQENPTEIAFHLWLQYRAEADLAAAHAAALGAGAPIGLIADLAVGTGHDGSHSWSRQEEILQDLEIGAPPDLINREGQSWGITAFSPRGLRNGGFSAFIEMLRHALRHAGGVRIDHVMGLSRLWVIPTGFPSAGGVYLKMPADDLMRLVTLESHRHKAVILGEDLGTLPIGFGEKLDAAGIAGLRVMWFERDGARFTDPASWTQTAVAMTTTHDLPTVAGWWQGRDIEWRIELDMQGDSQAERAADRGALWAAFEASGATTAAEPPTEEGAAATDAAAAHLGLAACTLALLPIEDALALPEQPNLPGTLDEHPNWRRRLPGDAQTIFAQPDFQARLRALAQARRCP